MLLCVGSAAFAQNSERANKKFYIGPGIGFDYGGLGGKVEFLPIKYVGVFAGAGYNLLSVGWNVGGTVKILPDKVVSPNIVVMYGYNAALTGLDSYAKQYNMTSYGVTAGINLDIKVGKKGHKISPGVFLPFRSEKFKENYKKAEDDPNMTVSFLMPITFSVGFNFALF
jgi:hypothetical protein